MSLSRRTKIPNTRSHADPGSRPIDGEGRSAHDRRQRRPLSGLALLLERVSTENRFGAAIAERDAARESMTGTEFQVFFKIRRKPRRSMIGEAIARRSLTGGSERFRELAGRQGFEPRYRGPEPRVLPLDDLPVRPGVLVRQELSIISHSKVAPHAHRTRTGSAHTHCPGMSFTAPCDPVSRGFSSSPPVWPCCCFRR